MKKLILIDGNSLMYRAYFGLKTNQMTNSKGIFTNATYSFARMINTLVENNNFDAICVAFDAGKKTFRHSIFDSYKDGRAPMPDELRMQIAYIKEFLDLKRIKRYELQMYEADDIIGTLAKEAEENGYLVDVYSSDKDLLQLVSSKTTVHLTKKGFSDLEDYTPSYFNEKYGIEVSSFIDLKALMGDKSDNIPGVPGIGEKKALKYLQEYNNLEGIYEHIDLIKGADNKKLKDNYDLAFLCRKMVTILRESPLEIKLEDCLKQKENTENLNEFYKELEFYSFLKKNNEIKEVNINFRVINNDEELKNILLPNSYIMIENSNYNYHKFPVLALSITNELGTFIIEPNLFKSELLKIYLEDKNILKKVFDYKRIYVSLKHFNIDTKGINFDLLLATYILNPKVTKQDYSNIINYYEYYNLEKEEDIYNKGAKRSIPSLEILYPYLAKKSYFGYLVINKSLNELENSNQLSLLNDIEIPLSYVLAKMEYNGMKVDLDELDYQDKKIVEEIKRLELDIHASANKVFNINSPKQLAEVLFTDLNIPYPGNSKKGYSTDISVLEQLTEYEIITKIISYRQLTKLYSSYIKGLTEQIFADMKVHTIFEQALTETGRLSSVEPNLQNIPIKTKEGALIRKMFIPSEQGNKLYSADYSQIELRVLASLGNVKNFIEAFNNNVDIHTSTARLIFKHEDITPLERRKAKAVNFGIVYGISPFGLAKDIDVSQNEAKEFIENYNNINPEIKEYTLNSIKEATELGYISTIKNRRRYIPELKSSIYLEREFGKRVAMNAPIQGSAADIIKIAMINIDKELEERNFKSKMLVTVHDELVFDCYLGEEEKLQELVRRNMKNAVSLKVKLEVEDNFGNNWFELK